MGRGGIKWDPHTERQTSQFVFFSGSWTSSCPSLFTSIKLWGSSPSNNYEEMGCLSISDSSIMYQVTMSFPWCVLENSSSTNSLLPKIVEKSGQESKTKWKLLVGLGECSTGCLTMSGQPGHTKILPNARCFLLGEKDIVIVVSLSHCLIVALFYFKY